MKTDPRAPDKDKSAIRDAASVIVLRHDLPHAPEGAVLMGMRGAGAAFMPSKYVFPGGAVDAGDSTAPLFAPINAECHARLCQDLRSDSPLDPANVAQALTAAAIRELAEETGLLLQGGPAHTHPWPSFDTARRMPSAANLRFVFRAITPPGRPRRFDARFFLCDIQDFDQDPDDFSNACDELSHLHWVALSQARQLDLPFITEVILTEITDPDRKAGVPFFDNRGAEPRFIRLD